jgi:hypothetical protein
MSDWKRGAIGGLLGGGIIALALFLKVSFRTAVFVIIVSIVINWWSHTDTR